MTCATGAADGAVPEAALVVMARAPERGRVKTRLAAAVGEDGALAVYRQLLAITAATAAGWPGPVLLAATGDGAAFAGTGLEALPRVEQTGESLGERIANAVLAGLRCAPAAVVIGTDCPALRREHLDELVGLLAGIGTGAAAGADATFGPAADGGFWGLATGVPRAAALLAAREVPWSSPATLRECRALLERHGLTVRLGSTLADLDVAADLRVAVAAGLLASPVDPATLARRGR